MPCGAVRLHAHCWPVSKLNRCQGISRWQFLAPPIATHPARRGISTATALLAPLVKNRPAICKGEVGVVHPSLHLRSTPRGEKQHAARPKNKNSRSRIAYATPGVKNNRATREAGSTNCWWIYRTVKILPAAKLAFTENRCRVSPVRAAGLNRSLAVRWTCTGSSRAGPQKGCSIFQFGYSRIGATRCHMSVRPV